MSNMKDVSINGGKLPIKEFKLDQLSGHPAIVMIAKRRSGKSVVVRAILKHFNDIPAGVIISPTDRMNSFYGCFYPDSYVHYGYKSSIIEKLLMRQTILIEKNVEKNKIGKKIDTRAFIVMDDCLADRGSWIKDQPIQEILFNGRHYHIMYILTMQFPLGITPNLRANFDYIFLLADDQISNMKKIYDHYAGMISSFNAFRQIFTKLTENYGCMVLAVQGVARNPLEKIYWYKAPNPDTDIDDDSLKYGCKQFRDYNDKNYDKNWNKKSGLFNFEKFIQDKKGGKEIIEIEKEQIDEKGDIVDRREISRKKYNNHK